MQIHLNTYKLPPCTTYQNAPCAAANTQPFTLYTEYIVLQPSSSSSLSIVNMKRLATRTNATRSPRCGPKSAPERGTLAHSLQPNASDIATAAKTAVLSAVAATGGRSCWTYCACAACPRMSSHVSASGICRYMYAIFSLNLASGVQFLLHHQGSPQKLQTQLLLVGACSEAVKHS